MGKKKTVKTPMEELRLFAGAIKNAIKKKKK
jgi:hypothetical protein